MSPYAGSLLLQIMPLIKATVMRTIKPVGCEDHEEVVQDATVMAADMLLSKPAGVGYVLPERLSSKYSPIICIRNESCHPPTRSGSWHWLPAQAGQAII